MSRKNLKMSKNIRKNILIFSHLANSSHVGSCLSIVDILTSLYNDIFKLNSKKKIKQLKNRFILSKGHACLALYCLLYEKKIISKKLMNTYGKNESILMQHASHYVRGVNFSTGSLGHGLPVAVGLALSNKIKKNKNKVYVLMSDGEMNEGTTWEAMLFANYHKLNNLVVIIDNNKLQSLTYTRETLNVEPLDKKFKSFGCKVLSVNGHDHKKLTKSLKYSDKKKPLVIIANTIKGKGVSFMENNIDWHYKSPTKKQLIRGIQEINNA
tara:strand:- start:7607 stop:8410 length:804 start_codon:yes stop_codon:yes gene_type:complete